MTIKEEILEEYNKWLDEKEEGYAENRKGTDEYKMDKLLDLTFSKQKEIDEKEITELLRDFSEAKSTIQALQFDLDKIKKETLQKVREILDGEINFKELETFDVSETGESIDIKQAVRLKDLKKIFDNFKEQLSKLESE